ncbi:MAG: HU family DNA-binding protein [Marinilabiliaceae bacterium]|nr:HU family DNA-binding protein [Marinilabiliaceae bacterium]
MSVKYKVASTYAPGAGKEGSKVWFPKITGTQRVDIREVARLIQRNSSATEGDVLMIVNGLVQLIPELLMQGCTVNLDELGTFSLHASVQSVDDPDKVNSRMINAVKMRFRPSKRIQKELKGVKFVKVNDDDK